MSFQDRFKSAATADGITIFGSAVGTVGSEWLGCHSAEGSETTSGGRHDSHLDGAPAHDRDQRRSGQ
jgi:hypothetical protein